MSWWWSIPVPILGESHEPSLFADECFFWPYRSPMTPCPRLGPWTTATWAAASPPARSHHEPSRLNYHQQNFSPTWSEQVSSVSLLQKRWSLLTRGVLPDPGSLEAPADTPHIEFPSTWGIHSSFSPKKPQETMYSQATSIRICFKFSEAYKTLGNILWACLSMRTVSFLWRAHLTPVVYISLGGLDHDWCYECLLWRKNKHGWD